MSLERGNKVLIEATVDALMTGLNSRSRIRVIIGTTKLWVPLEAVHEFEPDEPSEADVQDYIKEELKKRLCVMSID